MKKQIIGLLLAIITIPGIAVEKSQIMIVCSFSDYASIASEIAKGYNSSIPVKEMHSSVMYSAGSMESTVGDLYKWNKSLYKNKLLSKDSINKSFKPYINNYGYGWFIIDKENAKIMGHTGKTYGFASLIYRDEYNKRTIIILSNEAATDTTKMNNDIISFLNKRIYSGE